ncbi:unnamed protein product [Clavelina lepadiformis]|uniref:Uncharacterized protein n=1 Tax=Clavelina lepadiformis TaxID=159417 RepID=A0ABP0FZQ7_CLALP
MRRRRLIPKSRCFKIFDFVESMERTKKLRFLTLQEPPPSSQRPFRGQHTNNVITGVIDKKIPKDSIIKDLRLKLSACYKKYERKLEEQEMHYKNELKQANELVSN